MKKAISLLPLIICVLLINGSCNFQDKANKFASDNYSANQSAPEIQESNVICGADRLSFFVPKLKGKKVGLVANQSSRVHDKHLLDSLLELEVDIKRIFSPEHGFRGEADAGMKINDQIDSKTGLPLISLYGDKRRPRQEDLQDLDVIIFDIQDVGVRFYTFISTLHYVMDACAEYDVELMVLDRPNPNGHYLDGPMRKEGYQSFVGMHPVPVVYGMSIGEYAQMINGEGWLANGIQCKLEIIELKNYTHETTYRLPIKPSPNLPTLKAVLLYPSLCFFEPTMLSIGRGTQKQFQVIGYPDWSGHDFEFTPVPNPGAMKPKLQDQLCKGIDLTVLTEPEIKSWRAINLDYLVNAYAELKDRGEFFTSTSFFDKLAGSDQLRKQLVSGLSASEIITSWQEDLEIFKVVRQQYLLYE